MPTELEQAVAAQVVWKPGPVLRAAIELVKAGLSELDKGRAHFGCDNVPESYQYEGQGICGVATRMLIHAEIIVPSQHHAPADGIFHGRRKSVRGSAHARRVDLYELRGRALAESFVSRHDSTFKVSERDWIQEVRQTGKVQGNFVSQAEQQQEGAAR
jgi:hypothetical protein